MSWHSLAACLGSDPSLWFPQAGESADEAKAICTTCPVRDDCLNDAMNNRDMHGIRGGLSVRERRRLAHSLGIE